jgi:ABC-type molybdate transport system ATPase subunit
VENLLPVRVSAAGGKGGPCAVLALSAAPGAGSPPGAQVLAVGGVASGLGDNAPGLLCVRPEDVVLAAAGDDCGAPSCNRLQGTIASVTPQGPFLKVTVECGVRLTAAITAHVARQLAVDPGRAVTVALRPADLYVIPRS